MSVTATVSMHPELALAGVGLALFGIAPVLLARAAWPVRRPIRGLLAWQAVGLAGGLTLMVAAVLTASSAALLTIAVTVLAARYLWVLLRLHTRAVSVRRRQRDLLTLLSEPAPDPAGPASPAVHVVPADSVLAYAVPGRPGRVVVSSAAMAQLPTESLRGLVEHERAHLRQHHYLVTLPFDAWAQAFPGTSSRRARAAVHVLVETLADDAACRRVDAERVASGLLLVASRPLPAHLPVPPGCATCTVDVAIRLRRLAGRHQYTNVTTGTLSPAQSTEAVAGRRAVAAGGAP